MNQVNEGHCPRAVPASSVKVKADTTHFPPQAFDSWNTNLTTNDQDHEQT